MQVVYPRKVYTIQLTILVLHQQGIIILGMKGAVTPVTGANVVVVKQDSVFTPHASTPSSASYTACAR
jgi:branched-subunit amino acid aminotransferase/4-amino-4-deoxychorismate lyase